MDRAEILGRVIDGRLSQIRAAELLSMTDKHSIFRLYRQHQGNH
jgi:hypothetical protein